MIRMYAIINYNGMSTTTKTLLAILNIIVTCALSVFYGVFMFYPLFPEIDKSGAYRSMWYAGSLSFDEDGLPDNNMFGNVGIRFGNSSSKSTLTDIYEAHITFITPMFSYFWINLLAYVWLIGRKQLSPPKRFIICVTSSDILANGWLGKYLFTNCVLDCILRIYCATVWVQAEDIGCYEPDEMMIKTGYPGSEPGGFGEQFIGLIDEYKKQNLYKSPRACIS
ncbi:hypothetical protein AX774_g3123 [Zancudomyces culisetae]|uniref:Uncharacterized protein n=1 Tax=Zancudomyces culisetae TaxID=1213189 RepID=A0A1R1PR33_ZANCU|nr:hypothetical protein AX774_g3123 [Zancudomyces culisetae]|eukprot:OMH83363.1 hypothetical protein AX774_g3123 [Zancudomyces culisetae]